jgi:protein phosphatase
MTVLTHAGLTDPGRRSHNEDRWLADPSLGMFLVADGVGGVRHGELAAQIITEVLPPLVRRFMRGVPHLGHPRATERIREVVRGLNLAVRAEGSRHPSFAHMGAAIVLALVWDGKALIAHVGDSRAYFLHESVLRLLTKDHSVVQRLIDEGKITPKQAANHDTLGQLTRYVGLEDDVQVDVCLTPLAKGDRLLLCSDGVSGMLSDTEIQGILTLPLPLPEVCRLLVDTANLMGGDDNITVIVVEPTDPPIVNKTLATLGRY